VTAQRVLDAAPAVVQVVPLTSTSSAFAAEVTVEPDRANGLERTSAAQCQHVRSVSMTRVLTTRGNVGPAVLAQVRDVIGVILDIPA
jgi:mRNA interferase MazF